MIPTVNMQSFPNPNPKLTGSWGPSGLQKGCGGSFYRPSKESSGKRSYYLRITWTRGVIGEYGRGNETTIRHSFCRVYTRFDISRVSVCGAPGRRP